MRTLQKVNHPYNYNPNDHNGEVSNGESQTVVGESYTVQELFQRNQNGITDNVQLNGIYDEDVTHDSYDMREVSEMDLTEQAEIQKEQIDTVNRYQNQQKKDELKKSVEEEQRLSKEKSKPDETENLDESKKPVKRAP